MSSAPAARGPTPRLPPRRTHLRCGLSPLPSMATLLAVVSARSAAHAVCPTTCSLHVPCALQFFVRMEDLTGPSAEEVMSRVFHIMQQQQQRDRERSGQPGPVAMESRAEAARLLRPALASGRGSQGLHLRSCGHEVHSKCLYRCFASLRQDGQAHHTTSRAAVCLRRCAAVCVCCHQPTAVPYARPHTTHT